MSDDRVVRAAQQDSGDTPEELIELYRDGARVMREVVSGLDGEMLNARPIEGKMSSLEVLSHVADCEQFLADRMKRTIATDRPLLLGVEGNLYLDRLHYADRDPELQLQLIEVTREQMAEDLERLAPEDWEREAIHSETGLVTLRQLLLHSIRHVQRHAEAIAEKRRALGV